jgi:hypothetical protein
MRIWLALLALLPLLALIATAMAARGAAQPARTLIAGELRVPAARSFGDPGFHEVLIAAKRPRADVRTPTRFRLVLSLRDIGRPRQMCSSEHPLSGCATVDWADFLGRPKVPRDGVFQNTVNVELASGRRTFFLSPSGALARHPNPYEDG